MYFANHIVSLGEGVCILEREKKVAIPNFWLENLAVVRLRAYTVLAPKTFT